MLSEVLEIEFQHASISLRKDGITEINSADDFEYDIEQIKENHEQIRIFNNGKMALVLNMVGDHTTITKEAREYMASGPHKNIIKAEAFVLQSVAQKIIARFYYKINQPIVPVGFFKTKAEAEAWLNSIKD